MRDTRIKKFDEWLHRDVQRIGLNLFERWPIFGRSTWNRCVVREKIVRFNRTDGVNARTKAPLYVKFL